MFNLRSIRSLAAATLFIVLASVCVMAQSKANKKTASEPSEKPHKVTGEKDNAFKKWINEDVSIIITDAEKTAFNKLQTNEERENFIEIFWRRRDPNPDTEENEFREEYYQRIAYANEHFASGVTGWRTDRGRIYIRWGKPDSVESHPSGGSYDRPSYEGGGSTTTYPFETWFYRHLDGPGDGVEIEFVDQTGTGEYRISRDADEKNALATVPGAGQRNNPVNNSNTYQREQDSPFSRQLLNVALSTPSSVKFTDLQNTLTDSPVIDSNPLAFDLRVDYFRQSDDRVITAFTVQTGNKELSFKSNGGLETATLNIFGRITAVSNKRGGIFEDSVTTNATTAELAELKEKKSVYQKAVALAPGIYKVDVVVRDTGTGSKGVVSLGFVVPKYAENKLSTSSLVLASKLRAADDRDIGQQFVIGGTKVIPNLGGLYKQGQEIGIYLQVYNAITDETTLRPAVDVNYVLLKDGKEVLRQTEDWNGLSDSGRRLTLARLLPTADLQVGEYEVKVEINDRVRNAMIENKSKFTIIR